MQGNFNFAFLLSIPQRFALDGLDAPERLVYEPNTNFSSSGTSLMQKQAIRQLPTLDTDNYVPVRHSLRSNSSDSDSDDERSGGRSDFVTVCKPSRGLQLHHISLCYDDMPDGSGGLRGVGC